MSTERLDELVQRLRTALAAALQRETARDPAWRKFESTLEPAPAAEPPQNGISPSGSPPDDNAGF